MKCGTRIIVADNAINRENTFWRESIGKRGTFVCEEVDGLWAITLDHLGVVDGVKPERLLPLDQFVRDERPWWKRTLRIGNAP